MDHSYRQMRNEALLMLQMKRLQQEISQHVTIVEASAISGEGRDAILRWRLGYYLHFRLGGLHGGHGRRGSPMGVVESAKSPATRDSSTNFTYNP
ncbi:hypothetical protein YQE_11927, partial [Dendroctonus ponderosae]